MTLVLAVSLQLAVSAAPKRGGPKVPLRPVTLALDGELPELEGPFAFSGVERKKTEARTVAGRSFVCRAWGASTKDGWEAGGCRDSTARELALGDGLVEETFTSDDPSSLLAYRVVLVAFGHDEAAAPVPAQRWADGTNVSLRFGEGQLERQTLRSARGRWLATYARLERKPDLPMKGLFEFNASEWNASPELPAVRTALEELVWVAVRGGTLWPCDWCEPH
jgi:hypothetical protein